jgi:hypothetical protein
MNLNLGMLLYILFCIGVGFGGIMYLFQSGRMISAGIFFIGAVLVFILFGLRWFVYDKPQFASNSWPPQINTCPDFLTYLNLNGKNVCIDTIGVSTNPQGLKLWTYGATPPTNPPVEASYYFDLTTTKSRAQDILAEYCQRCLDLGVTWEGVCDGESCYKFNPPTKPGTDGTTKSECDAPPTTPPPRSDV